MPPTPILSGQKLEGLQFKEAKGEKGPARISVESEGETNRASGRHLGRSYLTINQEVSDSSAPLRIGVYVWALLLESTMDRLSIACKNEGSTRFAFNSVLVYGLFLVLAGWLCEGADVDTKLHLLDR